jgi:hypothetical protein
MENLPVLNAGMPNRTGAGGKKKQEISILTYFCPPSGTIHHDLFYTLTEAKP